MFCSGCGAPISENSNFCSGCGRPLVPSRPEPLETELYRRQRASFHPTRWSRNTGVLTITTRRIRFEPHMFQEPFEVTYDRLAAVSDVGTFGIGPCFTLLLKDGREVLLSLNLPGRAQTQAVVDILRNQLALHTAQRR